ncbi:MAG: asparagine synthetase B [Candidatus Zixiibacteriota bacterium]
MKTLLKFAILIITLSVIPGGAFAQVTLIPMDETQTDHLKAYGIAFKALELGKSVEWLLNYRGGSFAFDSDDELSSLCLIRGVSTEEINSSQLADIYRTIDVENMERVLLEKVPAIAVYSPKNLEPWDDAVTLALTYAEIKYDLIWDEEVLTGALDDYDWIHLHHEDFTGQYGKFYASFHNELWYRQEVETNETLARRMGFHKVSDMKEEVARTIKDYVRRGGFLFAMCSACETIDIALAAEGVDICPPQFDGDPVDPGATAKLDYSKCLSFENFTPSYDPLLYRHSDIDTYPDRLVRFPGQPDDYFYLFEFSAKLDPVPTMLVQDHVGMVQGFMGQNTGFRKSLLKKYVTILGMPEGYDEVRYIHGNFGRGTFTFLSGHDPEDYQHMVNDPPTDLSLHKNSPGYRLILNNVLFPAAKKKERKT